jgi:hypothetical protein
MSAVPNNKAELSDLILFDLEGGTGTVSQTSFLKNERSFSEEKKDLLKLKRSK